MRSKRESFIDIAKAVAILAVLTDHSNGILYTNQNVALLSYFSVSLFILSLGVTTYFSFSNAASIWISVKKKCKQIIIPYIVASVIYYIVGTHSFNLEQIIITLTHFSASGPLYYVLLYLQLILIVPLVFKAVSNERCLIACEVLCGIVVVVLSYLTTNFSNVMSVYGGGGKLLGGTYLILLYLGMLFAKHYVIVRDLLLKKMWLLCFFDVFIVMSTVLWARFLTVDRFAIDSILPMNTSLNPPGLSLMTYSIIVFLMIFLVCTTVENLQAIQNLKVLQIVKMGGVMVGRHTLYIFLYHLFFMSYVLPCIKNIWNINIWVVRITYLATMIIGPILIEKVFEKIRSYIVSAYR